ncbi:MAG: tetratricopeptide repeat protein [Anaerolineae bacterium]
MDGPKKLPHSQFILSSLNHYVGMFADTDRVTAAHIGGELEALAKILGFGFHHDGALEQSVELWLKLFSMSHKHQKTGEWLPVIPVAIEKIDSVKLPLGLKIRLLNRMGQVYRIENRFKQAEELHQKALALCEESGIEDDFLLADCNFHLADNHQFSNYPELALPYIEKVLNAPTFDKFPASFQATVLMSAGLILHKLRHLEKAIYYQEKAAQIWENENDPIELARTHSNIGRSYTWLNAFNEAGQSFEIALNLTKDYPLETARILGHLGLLHLRKQEFSIALGYWESSTDLLNDQSRVTELEAELMHNIGLAHRLLGNYRESADFFGKAIGQWKTLHNYLELARSYGGLGETCLEWNKYNQAINFYDLALDIAKDYPSEKVFMQETLEEREMALKKLKGESA